MRSRETKVKVHNQWLETDREKHPSAQRKRLGRFIRVMTHFGAPWSKSLIVASTFATLVCLGVTYAMWTLPMDGSLEPLRFWLGLLPLAIILLSALFTVRGYSITNDALLIDRLFCTTRIPLTELQSVKFDPAATHRSIRTFG